MRILVTGVGGPAGRRVSELLLQEGHEVWGADTQCVDFPELTGFVQAPAARAIGYFSWLAVTAAGVDLVIPTVQEELPLVASGKQYLPCPVLIGSRESVMVAQDKYFTAQMLAASGVPVPQCELPGKMESSAMVGAIIGWPCLSKPRDGRGGRNVTIYDSPADFPALAALDDSYVLQEFAPGTEYTVNLFLEENMDTVVVLEKTALREGRTGNALQVIRVKATDVMATAVLAARAIGLTGPMDMDIRRRANGMPLVLEINARFGANICHAPEVLRAALKTRLPVPC